VSSLGFSQFFSLKTVSLKMFKVNVHTRGSIVNRVSTYILCAVGQQAMEITRNALPSSCAGGVGVCGTYFFIRLKRGIVIALSP
jgi:hypothetical protein